MACSQDTLQSSCQEAAGHFCLYPKASSPLSKFIRAKWLFLCHHPFCWRNQRCRQGKRRFARRTSPRGKRASGSLLRQRSYILFHLPSHKWVTVDVEFVLRNEVVLICGIEKASVSARGKIFLVNLLCPCKRNLCFLAITAVGDGIVGEELRNKDRTLSKKISRISWVSFRKQQLLVNTLKILNYISQFYLDTMTGD